METRRVGASVQGLLVAIVRRAEKARLYWTFIVENNGWDFKCAYEGVDI